MCTRAETNKRVTPTNGNITDAEKKQCDIARNLVVHFKETSSYKPI